MFCHFSILFMNELNHEKIPKNTAVKLTLVLTPFFQFSFLIHLKTENQRFSDVFRMIKREHWEEKS